MDSVKGTIPIHVRSGSAKFSASTDKQWLRGTIRNILEEQGFNVTTFSGTKLISKGGIRMRLVVDRWKDCGGFYCQATNVPRTTVAVFTTVGREEDVMKVLPILVDRLVEELKS